MIEQQIIQDMQTQPEALFIETSGPLLDSDATILHDTDLHGNTLLMHSITGEKPLVSQFILQHMAQKQIAFSSPEILHSALLLSGTELPAISACLYDKLIKNL